MCVCGGGDLSSEKRAGKHCVYVYNLFTPRNFDGVMFFLVTYLRTHSYTNSVLLSVEAEAEGAEG